MEQLGINLPALAAQIINFTILLLILRAVAYQPILRMLDERADRVRESLAEAERARAEARRTEDEFQQKRIDALKQGQEIVARANQAAERIHEEGLALARKEAADLLAKSRSEIERERQQAIADIRSRTADLALMAASRVLKSSLDTPEHYRLVEEALNEAEQANLSQGA